MNRELTTRQLYLIGDGHPNLFSLVALPFINRAIEAMMGRKDRAEASPAMEAAKQRGLYVKHICFVYSLHTLTAMVNSETMWINHYYDGGFGAKERIAYGRGTFFPGKP